MSPQHSDLYVKIKREKDYIDTSERPKNKIRSLLINVSLIYKNKLLNNNKNKNV